MVRVGGGVRVRVRLTFDEGQVWRAKRTGEAICAGEAYMQRRHRVYRDEEYTGRRAEEA